LSRFGDGQDGVSPVPSVLPEVGPMLTHDWTTTAAPRAGASPCPLNRIETYVLLEAVRAPKGVLALDGLDGPEEARFTAARRLEADGLLKLLGPSTYQVTRKGRDPRLLADVALEWIRRKP
jgi:hypothetical protein